MNIEDIEMGEWYYVIQQKETLVGCAHLYCAGIQVDKDGAHAIFHAGGSGYRAHPSDVYSDQKEARLELLARSLLAFDFPNAPKERSMK